MGFDMIMYFHSDEPGKDMISSPEEANIDYDDIENKSDVSDNLSRMSSGSASSNYMDTQFHPVESVSRVSNIDRHILSFH